MTSNRIRVAASHQAKQQRPLRGVLLKGQRARVLSKTAPGLAERCAPPPSALGLADFSKGCGTLRDPTRGRTNWRNLLTVTSVTVLVGTEVLGASLAAGWAIAGLFELGTTLEYVFMAGFSLLGLWAMVAFVKSALAVEPVTDRA